jgi:hypothetical protein
MIRLPGGLMIMQIVARIGRRRNRIKIHFAATPAQACWGRGGPGHALKNADMTNLGAAVFLRLPENTIGGETP